MSATMTAQIAKQQVRDIRGDTTLALASLRGMAWCGDLQGIIDACSGSNHGDIQSIWSLTMTALYGPTRLHQSYFGTDGLPDLSRCGEDARRRMVDAMTRLAFALGRH